jgi:hypothetical protein
MTPEERNLIDELFDRLAALEGNPRDPDAERAIREGLRQAPNAVYALVQTVLVQDEFLKRAEARIRELEGGDAAPQDTSFLGRMREQIWGRREGTRAGSVPSVQPGGMSSAWRNTGTPVAPAQPAPAAPEPQGGGSFLGTAMAAAAGVVGGTLLMGGLRSLMGPSHARGAFDDPTGSRDAAPWGGGAAGGDLARQAGLDDMGKAPRASAYDDGGRAGLFDSSEDDAGVSDQDFDAGDDADLDFDDSADFDNEE